jgi:ribosomal protein S27AE
MGRLASASVCPVAGPGVMMALEINQRNAGAVLAAFTDAPWWSCGS